MPNKSDKEGGGAPWELASGPGHSDTPPVVPGEKNAPGGGTRPPFAKPAPAAPPPPPPRVQVDTDDTPVAILGFSGSGKTVYLTMLYYATGVKHQFPEEWDADFLALDQSGETDRYLKKAYKLLLGIGPDGKLIFKDPLGKRVDRQFPKGTDEQEMLKFTLTRSTGMRDFKLNVNTLDVKGEALRRFTSDVATPKPEDLARDPTLRIDYQRWRQMRELCEQAGAILLFFNLLNWEDYDHTADVNTLVGLLLNQKRPPKAFAFVVTGIDVLKEEHEIERKREEIIQNFNVAIRKLEKRGVAWDVLMISNFGRGFTRKIETLPANHPCSGKVAGHICNRCQELVDDVKAEPAPRDLDKAWEFIYAAIEARRKRRLIKLGLLVFGLGVLPLGILGWSLLSGWQQNQRLAETMKNLTPDKIEQAVTLQKDVESNRIYRFFSAVPGPELEQLRELGAAHKIYNDPARPAAERLKVAQDVMSKLSPALQALVPLEDLKIAAELSAITTGSNVLERIEAANRALGNRERKPSERDKVVKVVEDFLAGVLQQLRKRNSDLQGVMSSSNPVLTNETAYIDTLRSLQSAIERGEVKTIKGATDIRNEVKPMIDDFTTYMDYVKVASLPDQDADQAATKADALAAFRRTHGQHVLRGAAGVLQVEVQNLAKDLIATKDFKDLPPFNTDDILRPGQRNFAQFAAIAKQYAGFVAKHKTGPRVEEVQKRLNEMKTHAEGLITNIDQVSDRERTAMKAQEIRRTMVEWETDVARTESDINALQDLVKIFPQLPVAAVRPKLEELVSWKRGALDVARIIATVPTNDTQVEDQRKELAALAQRLKDDVPARQQAQIEAGRLEDTLLANMMDADLNKLRTPDQATVDSPATAFQVHMKGHADFIQKYEPRFNTPERKARFQRFLADTQRRDPLKTSQDYRDRFAAKLAEKELWEKIDGAQKRRNIGDKADLLRDTQAYLDHYPTGEKIAAVRSIRELVEAWRVEQVKFQVDIFDATAASSSLTITVWPVNRTPQTAPLVKRSFPITNRHVAPSAAIEFNWNSAQDVELEVLVTGALGQEIYKELRPIKADQFSDLMTRLFPARAGINFKLKPQT